MRNLLTLLALLMLSSSWLFLIDIFTPPDMVIFSLMILLSAFLLTISIAQGEKRTIYSSPSNILILFIAFLVSSVLIKTPYNIGPIILALSQFVLLLGHRYRFIGDKRYILPFYWSMVIIGLTLSIFTFIFPIYIHVESRSHDLSILSPLAAMFVKMFYPSTYLYGKVILIQTVDNVYPFTVSTDKLGILLILLYMLSFLIFLFTFERDKKLLLRNILIFSIISFFYLFIRYLILIFAYLNSVSFEALGFFWKPSNIFISFLPLPFLMFRFIKFRVRIPTGQGIFKSDLRILVILFLSIFLLTFSILFEDPGIIKNGKVVVDEVHSEWENTTQPLNKTWYGTLSTYNYYSWVQWMRHYYNVTINENNTLTYSYLKDFDILILKCPTKPFLPEEIEDILKFVRNGGGLYVVGDHTNVFGMSAYFYPLVSRFGVDFNFDATSDYPTGSYSQVETKDFLFVHPIMKKVEVFKFLTSCTLSAPLFTEDVIVGNGIYREPGTYATETFFRSFILSPDEEAGFFLQAVALKYGKGRIVVFSDSTVFSSFCVFMDGYTNFNLGVMEYLNRENCYNIVNAFIFILSILLMVTAFILSFKKGYKISIFSTIATILLAISVSMPSTFLLNEINYTLPEPKEKFESVVFLSDGVDAIIDPHTTYRSLKDAFNTFFVVVQRLNLYPVLKENLMDAIETGNAVVIINPKKVFSEREIESLISYVDGGGKLLLMDSIYNMGSTSNQILLRFGLSIEPTYAYLSLNNTEDNISKSIAFPTLMINTLDENVNLIENNLNNVCIAYRDYGKGRVMVVVDSSSFSNFAMEFPTTYPNEQQRSLYNTSYFIFENLLG